MKVQSFWNVLVATVVLGMSPAGFAADQCGGNINFAPDKSNTQVKGQVLKNNICSYSFYAKKGQTLVVTMGKHDHPLAFLYSPVEQELSDGRPFILPYDGKYELRVGMTRNDARKYSTAQPFTMNFSITAPSEADAQQVNIATSGYAGNYHGIIPCITCKGVDTYLALYNDGSYTLSEKYLGYRENPSFAQQGNWMVYGPAIVLQPLDKEGKTLYLIAQNGDVYFVSQKEAGAAQPKVEADYRLKRD